jgi:hypothetical protein
MRVTYRLPTDQYAYIEVTDEVSLETEAMEIRARYEELKHSFAAKEGVDDKTIDKFVENQLLGTGNDVEVYNLMSPEQVKWVQRIKRAINRIKAKTNATD